MKKLSLYILFCILFISINSGYADTLSPRDTMEHFFHALKNGDIGNFQNLIAGGYYIKKRKQIENNAKYSEFLRNYYQNSVFKISGMQWDHASVFFDVEVITDGSLSAYNRYRLDKNGNGQWRITEELPQSF